MAIELSLPLDATMQNALTELAQQHGLPLDAMVADYLVHLLYGEVCTPDISSRRTILSSFAAGSIPLDAAMQELETDNPQMIYDLLQAHRLNTDFSAQSAVTVFSEELATGKD